MFVDTGSKKETCLVFYISVHFYFISNNICPKFWRHFYNTLFRFRPLVYNYLNQCKNALICTYIAYYIQYTHIINIHIHGSQKTQKQAVSYYNVWLNQNKRKWNCYGNSSQSFARGAENNLVDFTGGIYNRCITTRIYSMKIYGKLMLRINMRRRRTRCAPLPLPRHLLTPQLS